ncbi:unnamed protein product, partial [marine sediment metagenome]
PDTATIVEAYLMFKFRMIENKYEDVNKLNEGTVALTSQVFQIQDGVGGDWADGINLVDDFFTLASLAREGGDVIIGTLNVGVADVVDGNDTYNVRLFLGKADFDFINFDDCQVVPVPLGVADNELAVVGLVGDSDRHPTVLFLELHHGVPSAHVPPSVRSLEEPLDYPAFLVEPNCLMRGVKIFGVIGIDLDGTLSRLDKNIVLAGTLIRQLVLLGLVAVGLVKEYPVTNADEGSKFPVTEMLYLGVGIRPVLG